MKINDAGNAALNLLFPKRCPWCGKVVGFAEHDECEKELETLWLADAPVQVAEETSAHLQEAWACYRYESPVTDAIWRFKLRDEPGLATQLGRCLAKRYKDCLSGSYDLIVPVPVSRRTQRSRGYNQSALLAGVLSEAAGLPCNEKVLVKIRETRRQMELGREERRTNILGAYEVRQPQAVQGKRILLVDDVLTTGATLNECAKTLLEAGAAAVGALCLASA